MRRKDLAFITALAAFVLGLPVGYFILPVIGMIMMYGGGMFAYVIFVEPDREKPTNES